MNWDVGRLSGHDGADWRVPVSELQERRSKLASALAKSGFESALIDDPVELYYLTGGRQNGILLVGAEDSTVQTTHFVRRSLERAIFESGDSDAPNPIVSQPRMGELADTIRSLGGTRTPAMLAGKLPQNRWSYFTNKLSSLSDVAIIISLIKDDFEILSIT